MHINLTYQQLEPVLETVLETFFCDGSTGLDMAMQAAHRVQGYSSSHSSKVPPLA